MSFGLDRSRVGSSGRRGRTPVPSASIGLGLCVVALVHLLFGPTVAASLVGLLVLTAALVWVLMPATWARARSAAARRRIRREVTHSWDDWCRRLGLTVLDYDGTSNRRVVVTPVLGDLRWSPSRSTDHADLGILTGSVRLAVGQTVDHLSKAGDGLAAALEAHSVTMTRSSASSVVISWHFSDSLATPVRPIPSPAQPDLEALPLGLREDQSHWLLRLAGTHSLIVGATGAGKGSVIWSMLSALGPAIASGWVQVWAVDCKAGMELSPGRAMFTRFATTPEFGVDLLEDAVSQMTARASRLAQTGQRTHSPTVAEPLIVVLVDEVALLTAYLPDRTLKGRAERALATLATQGRAPGVVLVAALQDPRKEVLNLRNLFPTKIGMRLDEKAQVNMVLGEGAREAGALCDRIPESTPGVAYVRLEGVREPARVRASYFDDEAVADLAATFPAPSAASAEATSSAATSGGA